jgi:hypothetical protein
MRQEPKRDDFESHLVLATVSRPARTIIKARVILTFRTIRTCATCAVCRRSRLNIHGVRFISQLFDVIQHHYPSQPRRHYGRHCMYIVAHQIRFKKSLHLKHNRRWAKLSPDGRLDVKLHRSHMQVPNHRASRNFCGASPFHYSRFMR